MASGGAGAISARLLGGWALDRVALRRLPLLFCCLVTIASVFVARWVPGFWPILCVHFFAAAAGSLLSPLLTAVSQQVTSAAGYVARIGRNESFNHLGNTITAMAVATFGSAMGVMAGLWAIVGLAGGGCLLIPILSDRADQKPGKPDGSEDSGDHMTGMLRLLRDQRLLVFFSCYFIFNLANAASVPLLIEREAASGFGTPKSMTSLCVVMTQAVMVPVAYFTGRYAEQLRRRPLILLALTLLPLRMLLIAASPRWEAVCAAEALDGVTSGIILVMFFAIIADVTKEGAYRNRVIGSGLALGTLGALISNAASGLIASSFGFVISFIMLACLGSVSLLLCFISMPETGIETD